MTLTIPDCFYRTSIKGLVTNDAGKVLLLKEENGMRELPWGGLEFGESPQEGLTRELQEEMGLYPASIADNPSYYTTWQENNIRKSNVIYKVVLNGFNFTPSEECVAIDFLISKT